MVKSQLYDLCRSSVSVSSKLAEDPTIAPSVVCGELYGHHGEEELAKHSEQAFDENQALDRAFNCGRWGETKPSELFLQIYRDVLHSLGDDPLGGVCSPSLLGSNGVCPLTILATIPDICRHMSNLIVRARHEVFLATNYWMYSEGSRLIANAFKELSKRAVQDGRNIVVKVMYDRGDVKQVFDNHQKVLPSTYTGEKGKIGLPHPDEIPNVSIEVVNYHRPPLGTFHAKFMIVDRRIAVVQSNNIQDNDNLEMMVQYEGDIVDSLYDTALITWHNPMVPPFPCVASPVRGSHIPAAVGQSSQPDSTQSSNDYNLQKIALDASQVNLPQHTSADPHYDQDLNLEVIRAIASLNPKDGETRIQSVSRLLNGPAPNNQSPSHPEITPEEMITPMIPIPPHTPFPIAMVNRPPYPSLDAKSINTPQNVAFISAFRHAKSSIFIQTPDLNAAALLPEILSACRRGIQVVYSYCLGYNDVGELLPGQGGHNEGVANTLYTQLEPQYRPNLAIYAYVAKDQIRPIHNKFKKRSCHIKLMIVDQHIGIQGSGNQDTQSWYHSQECNVMIDSEVVCGMWLDGLKKNTNTFAYGAVERSGERAGCWVDPETRELAEGSIGVDAGRFAWARGVIGAINRVRGVGGF